MVAAKEISMNATVATVFSEVDGIFTLKKSQERHCRLFSEEKMFSFDLLCCYLSQLAVKTNVIGRLFASPFLFAFYGLFGWICEINPR